MRVGRVRRPRVRYKTELEVQRELNAKEDRVLSRRWYYLVFVLVVLSIIARLPLLAVVGILFFLVLVVTDIWAAYCLTGVSYKRRLSETRAMFGEEVTLSLVVENEKVLPLPWLETADAVPRVLPIKGYKKRIGGGGMGNIVTLDCLFSPRWYDRVTRNYTISCNVRGVHTFGPTVIRSGDVFGFVSRETQLSQRQYLLIYPLVVPITSLGLPARHPFGDRRAPRRLLEDPSRVVGVRDYVYGDSLRRVNWKATARTMELQSKVYEATTTYTMVLFLNSTMRLDDYYGIHPELQELAICAAASLTNWCMDQGYAVGLYSNSMMFIPDEEIGTTGEHLDEGSADDGDDAERETREASERTAIAAQLKRRRIRVAASSNEAQRQRIMDVLARIQPYFGTSIEDVIQAERRHLPAGATVVVITSNISDALLDNLARLRQSGHAISILFVGDAPPPLKLSGVIVYHIGGEETWKQFIDAYGGGVTSKENTSVVVEAPTLHL